MKESTDNPRAAIDRIDDELLRLLNERAALALKVGEVKRRVDTSLCDNQREREVLARLCQQNSGPLDEQNLTNIFQRIIDECLQVQLRAPSSRPWQAGRELRSSPRIWRTRRGWRFKASAAPSAKELP